MSNIMKLIDDYANCCQADGAHDLIDDHETTVAARTAVVEAVEKLERDAARYRWLRDRHWAENTLCVVKAPKDSVIPGSMCPADDILDRYVDEAMEATK